MMSAVDDDGVPSGRDYPIADALRAEVLKDYFPEGEFSSSQLVLMKGNIVWVLEQHESGWWGGHKEGDDLTGWFPKSLVRPTDNKGEGDPVDDVPLAAVRERCSRVASPRGAELALFTSDHRAVASPQTAGGARRRLTIHNGPDPQESTSAAELVELGRRLEATEKEREKERQERERERQVWDQERQQLELRARELEAEKHTKELEVQRLHEEMLRREAKEAREESSSHSVGSKDEILAWASSGSSSRGRGSSTGLSRRLFPHASAPLEGSRTPPAGPPPVIVPMAAGSVSAPSMPTIAAVPTMPPTGPLSARHNVSGPHAVGQPPRPTPRTASTAPPWMLSGPGGAATVGVPSSPRHRPRQFAASVAPAGRDDGSKIEVRALVSAFERRSNSQGAPQTNRSLLGSRAAEPSPSRQMIYTAGNAGGPPGQAIGSSSRAGSREVPMRTTSRGLTDHLELETLQHTMSAGPSCCEEPMGAVNFGMSPMQRQHHLHHVARQGISAQSCSPPSKAPISVQDRIRQLNSGRLGR